MANKTNMYVHTFSNKQLPSEKGSKYLLTYETHYVIVILFANEFKSPA